MSKSEAEKENKIAYANWWEWHSELKAGLRARETCKSRGEPVPPLGSIRALWVGRTEAEYERAQEGSAGV